MGFYINPDDCSKEEWLAKNAEELSLREIVAFDFSSDYLPVCWVDNGFFTAAAIAYDAGERNEFLQEDGRPKIWFKASKNSLSPWYK